MAIATARQVSIRRLKEKDQPLLEEMYTDSIPPAEVMGLPPRDPDRRREWLQELREGINLVAFVDGTLAGHLVVMRDEGRGEIVAFVRPEFRRQGVAMALAHEAVDLARKENLTALWVLIETTNVAARRGLLKFGFEREWATMREMQLAYPLRNPEKTP
jgi:GNAT superfamily N-acetyltransferase